MQQRSMGEPKEVSTTPIDKKNEPNTRYRNIPHIDLCEQWVSKTRITNMGILQHKVKHNVTWRQTKKYRSRCSTFKDSFVCISARTVDTAHMYKYSGCSTAVGKANHV